MRICLFAMAILFSVAAYGQSIFKCRQPNGVTAYQDHPCPGAKNNHPNMIIKPLSGDGSDPDSSSRLSPQQRAQLMAGLERLRAALQKIDTSRAAMTRYEAQRMAQLRQQERQQQLDRRHGGT
ncbi:DUF4124 domain-containing protein [Dyella sp. A6]|uniref:DUF4124 domain-containing protein n=1 Tax=Dyella aluminiiresistens TaxID=3069105 RepID=UPI002E78A42E|nr:DUF4124 domain-containing protein [Dyella sp. A6]